MKFDKPVLPAVMIKRYKRFLADVRLENGDEITVHCANSGSMKTCWGEDWPVLIQDSQNPKRKLQYTLEMTHNGDTWIGVNTQVPNQIVKEALKAKKLSPFLDYDSVRPEVKISDKSRIDFYLDGVGDQPDCLIEVKNVTLLEEDGCVSFPDAVSTRGQKHLQELMDFKQKGYRCAMVYTVQRSDGQSFRPAEEIDPRYAQLLREAVEQGVEVYVFQASLSEEGVELLDKCLPVKL
ncbi:MAG: DNA/RNA nuclease SfsA [Lentisphaeria bacterium]|nr:DNA/RNA nuclease SfsA [Lentisphaeria bacterium]